MAEPQAATKHQAAAHSLWPSAQVQTNAPACSVQQHKNSRSTLATCQPKHVAMAGIKMFPGTIQ